MNFYETKMGQKFFCCQVPALIEALQSIAKVKASSAVIIPPLEDSKEGTDILFDLFYGNYQPKSLKRVKGNELDAKVKQTMDALLNALSQDAYSLFCEYESAANARGSSAMMQAFRDGFQLALQLILAGEKPARNKAPKEYGEGCP